VALTSITTPLAGTVGVGISLIDNSPLNSEK